MRILGTYNNYPFSKIIRFITGDSISHVILIFDDLIGFHANPNGTGFVWADEFLKKNKIKYNIGLPLDLVSEEQVFFVVIAGRKRKPYDWLGVIYQGVRRIKSELFKSPIPLDNKWADPNKDFCVEVLRSIPWDSVKSGLQEKFNQLPLEMMSPEEIILTIKQMLEDENGTNS